MKTSSSAVRKPHRRPDHEWVIGGTIVATAGRLLLLLMVGESLDAREFGRFVVWLSLIAVATVMGSLGMGRAGMVVISRALADGRTAAARSAEVDTVTVAATAGAIVSAIAAVIAGATTGDHRLAVAAVTFVWVFAESLIGPMSECRRARGSIPAATLGGDAGRVLAAVIAVALVWWRSPDLVWFAAAMAGSGALVAGVGLVHVVHVRRTSVSSPTGSITSMVRLGRSMVAVDLIAVAQRQALIWTAALVLSLDDVGWFTAAQRAAGLITLVAQTLVAYVTPMIAAAALPREGALLSGRLRRPVNRALGVSAGIAIATVLFGRLLMTSALGVSATSLVVVLALLGAANLVNVATGPAGAVLVLSGHQVLVQRIGIAATATMVMVSAGGAAVAGVAGLAVGSSAIGIIRNVYVQRRCRQLTSVDTRSSLFRSTLQRDVPRAVT